MLDLLVAGRSFADIARYLQISTEPIYTWTRQDRIDRGLVPGVSTTEQGELAAAKRRSIALDAGFAATKRAMELVWKSVPHKSDSRPSARWPLKVTPSSEHAASWVSPSWATTPGSSEGPVNVRSGAHSCPRPPGRLTNQSSAPQKSPRSTDTRTISMLSLTRTMADSKPPWDIASPKEYSPRDQPTPSIPRIDTAPTI